MILTDPDGLIISKEVNEIPGATYTEIDLNGDNDPDDRVSIVNRKTGDYLITVIPEPDSLATEIYSLEALMDGEHIILANDVHIEHIPNQPYRIESFAATTLGDTNGDGAMDIIDALFIVQYYVGLNPVNFIPENADTNCDGTVDIIDALLIVQYYVGLISGFC